MIKEDLRDGGWITLNCGFPFPSEGAAAQLDDLTSFFLSDNFGITVSSLVGIWRESETCISRQRILISDNQQMEDAYTINGWYNFTFKCVQGELATQFKTRRDGINGEDW